MPPPACCCTRSNSRQRQAGARVAGGRLLCLIYQKYVLEQQWHVELFPECRAALPGSPLPGHKASQRGSGASQQGFKASSQAVGAAQQSNEATQQSSGAPQQGDGASLKADGAAKSQGCRAYLQGSTLAASMAFLHSLVAWLQVRGLPCACWQQHPLAM